MTNKINQLILASTLFGATATQAVNSFNYSMGDVLIGFRKINSTSGASFGASAGGTNLVVNAGPISYFTNLAPNTVVTIGAYTGAQLSQVGTNSIGWSVFAYFDDDVNPPAVPGTLFITKPRDVLNTQAEANNCLTASAAINISGQMSAIAAGAVDNSAFSALNTPSAVLELDGFTLAQDVSYYGGVGSSLDFNGTFGNNFEKYTPANFITAAGGNPVRADFYWMYPVPIHTTAAAVYLGYFQLATNGVMTYTAYPSATVTAPVITGFTRTNTVSYIKFTTGSSGTYTLRGTNSDGLTTARTNWPAIQSISGNGSVNTLTDTNSNPNSFYIITAQ